LKEIVLEDFLLDEIDLSYDLQNEVESGLADLATLMNAHCANSLPYTSSNLPPPNFVITFDDRLKSVKITADIEFALRPVSFTHPVGLVLNDVPVDRAVSAFLGFSRISHFSADVNGTQTLTSDLFPSLDGHRFVFLTLKGLDLNSLTSDSKNASWEGNILAQIPIGNLAETVFVSSEFFHSSFVSVSYLEGLQVKLTFADGATPDLKAPMHFVLRVWYDEPDLFE
jgi:hypothetical protein